MATEEDNLPHLETLDAAIQHFAVPENCLLTTYVVVVEWMEEDGDNAADVLYKDGMSYFTINGMMHEVLHGDLRVDKLDEEGDDE